MNILTIPHNVSSSSMSLGDTALMVAGLLIMVWICRKIVDKWHG